MSEKDPFAKAPNADRAFAYGDDPSKSLPQAEEVLGLAHEMSVAGYANGAPSPLDAVHEWHTPALEAYEKQGGSTLRMADTDLSNVPAAREKAAVLADRRAEAEEKTRIMNAAADAMIRRGASRETDRQMGIAAADRANRKAAGLPPRVYNLK